MKVTGTTEWDDPKYIDWESPALIGDAKIKEIEEKHHTKYPDYNEIYDAVIDWLRENNYYYSGFTYQDGENTIPIIDDMWLFQVTYRTWGGVIAEAFPEKVQKQCEGQGREKGFEYCVWAWTAPEPERVPV